MKQIQHASNMAFVHVVVLAFLKLLNCKCGISYERLIYLLEHYKSYYHVNNWAE